MGLFIVWCDIIQQFWSKVAPSDIKKLILLLLFLQYVALLRDIVVHQISSSILDLSGQNMFPLSEKIYSKHCIFKHIINNSNHTSSSYL